MVLDKETVEIRFHARAGQGAKVASNIFVEGALLDGKYIQAFPEYGADRTGAPMRTFVRISKKQIRTTEQVIEPDVLLVLDSSLLDKIKVADGLKKDGLFIINTNQAPDVIRKKTGFSGNIHTVDATEIAFRLMGKNFPNVIMLGALSKLTGLVSLKTLQTLFKENYAGRLKPELVEANLKAMAEGYQIK
ncbi:MAG: 2-oxoacid:acceptor oxidoreductase family protein [archaeon]